MQRGLIFWSDFIFLILTIEFYAHEQTTKTVQRELLKFFLNAFKLQRQFMFHFD
jgi:hypothetical protein